MIRGRPQGAATTEQLRDAMQDRQQTDVRELKRPTAEGGQPAEPVRRAVPESTRRPMPGREGEPQRAMQPQPAHDTHPMQQQQQHPRQPMQEPQGAMHHVFAQQHAEDYRRRWLEIQSGFVDDPRTAVQYADQLVAEMIQRMVDVFAHEKRNLEGQWSQGDSVSTEDLRVALQRYRGFFERLLADR